MHRNRSLQKRKTNVNCSDVRVKKSHRVAHECSSRAAEGCCAECFLGPQGAETSVHDGSGQQPRVEAVRDRLRSDGQSLLSEIA